jgi:hypothetical protein
MNAKPAQSSAAQRSAAQRSAASPFKHTRRISPHWVFTVAGVLDGLLHRTVGEKVKAVLGKLE